MNNLHAPAVPSGPTTLQATNGGLDHLTFAELQRKKDNMEAELKALGGVLDSVCWPAYFFFLLLFSPFGWGAELTASPSMV